MNSALDIQSYQDWLVETCTYKDCALTIDLVGGVTSNIKRDIDLGNAGKIEGVYAIEPSGDKYRVYFDDVVFLQIYDECAHRILDGENRDEGVIGQYSTSSMLNYVKAETLIFDIVPGELMHFEVKTGDDWFHVITHEAPVVTARGDA